GRMYDFERTLMQRFLKWLGSPPLRLVLWNGQTATGSAEPPVVTVRFTTRAALLKTILNPQRYFGEGYADGSVQIEGDLREVVRMGYRASGATMGLMDRLTVQLQKGRNTLAGSQKNIHHHYDIGNDFYRLWLDERMLYTCAYYAEPTMTLEQAQLAKLDHVCRKLQLQPGQQVVEAGCGWGALAMHMAEHFGVNVRAYNISTEQIAYAREEADRRNLADRVEFVQDDYRNIAGACDAFVSVGMLEHVGPNNYAALGQVIDRTLKPGGRGLIHTIARHRPLRMNAWIDRHIFPGACPPTLRQMMDIFEPYHMVVLDVENLRLHYERTLVEWLNRYEANIDTVRSMFDERFVRMWRLYLVGSAEAFESGLMHLYKVVFSRYNDNSVPATREHLYQSDDRSKRAAM
ncbi:MAG: cyclopropane-fatty-acyl-phospholipid synthase family protein, partial [Phycisphaeraceae bacterium]